MTTHELAKMLWKQPDVELFINDEPVERLTLEKIITDDGKGGTMQAVILWTKE